MWIVTALIQNRGFCYFGPFSSEPHANSWAKANGFHMATTVENASAANILHISLLYSGDRIDEFTEDIEGGRGLTPEETEMAAQSAIIDRLADKILPDDFGKR